jgi:hypothetical protein
MEGRCRIGEETGWRGEVVEKGDGGEERCGGEGKEGCEKWMEGRSRKEGRNGWRGKVGLRDK